MSRFIPVRLHVTEDNNEIVVEMEAADTIFEPAAYPDSDLCNNCGEAAHKHDPYPECPR